MAKKSFEDYKRSFPSDELLCEMFGVANYDELFEAHYDQAAKLIRQGHVLAIYPSDVSIAKAASRGELTSEIGPNGREIMGLNKELYRQNCNLFGQVRNSIESSLRTWAMSWIRNQHEIARLGRHCSPLLHLQEWRLRRGRENARREEPA